MDCCSDGLVEGVRALTQRFLGTSRSISETEGGRSNLVDNDSKWIDTTEVIEKKGKIPVTGRYCTNRRLRDDYKVASKVLGSGMSGPVQLATSKDGEKCAVKSFKKHGLSDARRTDLKNEVEIYLALDHPHIARLMMVYEDDQEIHLVMEYMAGGELYDRLFDAKVYNEEIAANTCHQMLKAVSYMHAHQIAHRDLKLENFLYERKDNNHLKLIDFGFAKFWDRSTKMSQACGSTHYVAPEVLAKSYTLKADMWSLGVISFMLLTGSPPFQGSNDNEVLRKIKAGKIHWSTRFKRLSDGAQDFVKALLLMNPEERLDAAGALSHPWITGKGGLRGSNTVLDDGIKLSLRKFARASTFRRAVLSMMAWSLSAEDRAQLRNEFLSFDTENTGTITHLQMKEILETNYHIDSMEAEAVFSMMDTDHDDVIAYSEFLAAALQGRLKVHEDILRRTFRKFDIDNCGRITAEDLRNILGEQFEGTDAEDLIREADTNGDGMIEYDEFLQYFHNHEPHVEGAEVQEDAGAGPWTRKTRSLCRQPPQYSKRRRAAVGMLEPVELWSQRPT
ncbi:CPK2 [Symbiodinium sp. KB8]|nr:CPK2 [Symbiodinium sp. KB8]